MNNFVLNYCRFTLSWYDKELDMTIQYVYSMSKKGNFYQTRNTSDGVSHKKRISKQAFISAFETYINA